MKELQSSLSQPADKRTVLGVGLSSILWVLTICFLSSSSYAQAPGWSRGQQDLAMSYDECVRRIPLALQAEAYSKDSNSGGNFVAGTKSVHTAVIICSPAPQGRMLVQIVVASNGDGGGRERQCLQAQMDQLGGSRCGGNTGGGGNSTKWLYRDGGFTDVQVFHADGTATSEGNREATARWWREGNELVVKWWNGWTNRYPWSDSGGLSGVAISPSGERHSISLTRQ